MPTTAAATPSGFTHRQLRAPLIWGVVFGVLQAASPLAFFWLDPATVYALGLTLIAAVYVGFAVADGRRHVLVVETVVASVFVVAAACAELGSAWLIVAGLAGHGCKDLWQHRTGFVAGTRWWPPFCVTVDWVAAALIAVTLTAQLLPT
ncbi:hypothetical protein [Kineococcus arenarius]|uniref:hypothetical protein n=1 Tax=Kineococcus sp. SYSU DK007 TaxID=3383128 RepID=UPI003D7DB3B3